MERQPAKTLFSKISSPFTWSVGETVGTFFTEMRDNGHLLGKRCKSCGKVFCPPQDYCEHCFDNMDEWVELEDRGVIRAWTRMEHYFPGMPCDLPFAYALIQINGADTNLVHILRFTNFDDLAVGSEVQAVWKEPEEREGNIFDIAYFKLA